MESVNKSGIIDAVLVVVGAYLILLVVQSIRGSQIFNPQCVSGCYFDLFFIVPFGGIGVALIFVVYFRRKNRALKTRANEANKSNT
jgi:hypothetical protein